MLERLIGKVYETRIEAIEAVGEELSNQGIEINTYDYRTSELHGNQSYRCYFYKWSEGYEIKALETTGIGGHQVFVNRQKKS